MIELKCRKNSSLKVQVRSVPLIKQKKEKTNKQNQTKNLKNSHNSKNTPNQNTIKKNPKQKKPENQT